MSSGAGIPARRTPVHVAVIMDGNGRWARARGLPRLKGHEEGSQSVRAVVRACRKTGVKYLTLYAFSVENWKRPQSEIEGLMNLLVRFLRKHRGELHEERVRLRVMGRIDDLPGAVQQEIAEVVKATERYDEGHLIMALAYGGRTEIVDAARKLALRAREGKLDPSAIDEKVFSDCLYLPDVPDPDLLIRTSGEMRVSNFLLWQISYAELYVTPVLWPEFREEEFLKAIEEYGRRQRRFGDVGNQ